MTYYNNSCPSAVDFPLISAAWLVWLFVLVFVLALFFKLDILLIVFSVTPSDTK